MERLFSGDFIGGIGSGLSNTSGGMPQVPVMAELGGIFGLPGTLEFLSGIGTKGISCVLGGTESIGLGIGGTPILRSSSLETGYPSQSGMTGGIFTELALGRAGGDTTTTFAASVGVEGLAAGCDIFGDAPAAGRAAGERAFETVCFFWFLSSAIFASITLIDRYCSLRYSA